MTVNTTNTPLEGNQYQLQLELCSLNESNCVCLSCSHQDKYIYFTPLMVDELHKAKIDSV